MACADVNMDIQGADEESFRMNRRALPLVQKYQAAELIPEVKGPLHNLLQKQPAVLGSVQMVSGLFSVGMGIFFAVTQDMNDSLFTMFRVSHLTGVFFITAGMISNLLFKYPGLLPLSFWINCGCIIVAVAGACLIAVDLAQWNQQHEQHLIEILALCVLGLEVLLSAILCVFFTKETRSKST